MIQMLLTDINGLILLVLFYLFFSISFYILFRSVKALLAYLKVKGINTDELWNKINDLVVKTIIW